jgi:hypothetical protein
MVIWSVVWKIGLAWTAEYSIWDIWFCVWLLWRSSTISASGMHLTVTLETIIWWGYCLFPSLHHHKLYEKTFEPIGLCTGCWEGNYISPDAICFHVSFHDMSCQRSAWAMETQSRETMQKVFAHPFLT